MSNAICLFVRFELTRLGKVYPTKAQSVIEWLAHRLGLAAAAGDADDIHFTWCALFFFLFYVDDAGLACINDLLFDEKGNPVMIQVVDAQGVATVRQQRRCELYFDASMKITNYVGHGTPEKKQQFPLIDFLGVTCDDERQLRRLSKDKRQDYSELSGGKIVRR